MRHAVLVVCAVGAGLLGLAYAYRSGKRENRVTGKGGEFDALWAFVWMLAALGTALAAGAP